MYGIIGAGKLASHLTYLLKLKNQAYQTFNRSSDLTQLSNCDVILLAISDDAIKDFYNSCPEYHDKKWIHFSGALYFENIIGLHPMMSFSTDLFEANFYDEIHWVLDHKIEIEKYFPVKMNQVSMITQDKKAFYHALCVLTGNLPHLLWESLEKEYQKLGISKKEIKQYVKVSTDNYLKGLPATGPIVRQDLSTIEKNLANLDIHYQSIYQGILEVTHEKH